MSEALAKFIHIFAAAFRQSVGEEMARIHDRLDSEGLTGPHFQLHPDYFDDIGLREAIRCFRRSHRFAPRGLTPSIWWWMRAICGRRWWLPVRLMLSPLRCAA